MELNSPQIWVILGVLALIAELLSVSFVFVFLSIGALITALLAWTGVAPTLNAQLLSFSVVSVLSLVVLRKPLRAFLKKDGGGVEYSEFVGDKATVMQEIPTQGEGRVFYRGTEWIAIANNGQVIQKSKSVIIKKLDGIKLIVEEVF